LDVINTHASAAGHPVIVERVSALQETIIQRLERIDERLARIETQ